jgi:prepilin-type N-terminal cleavage/methylation domain-containing protein
MIRLSAQLRHRGFSLVEVLLATFILAIGLIMVATIFPVGADWTRQATEANVAQVVAQNAINIIRQRYSAGGTQAGQIYTYFKTSATPTSVQALPNLTAIPIAERTYQFGNSNPFPSQNPASCTYYWTALARVSPSQATALSQTYDIYIVVFRKGEAAQTFFDTGYNLPAGYSEVTGVRDAADPSNPAGYKHILEPTLLTGPYKSGTYNNTLDPPIKDPVPALGFAGIGVTSGTVFRQTTSLDPVNPSNTKALARPGLASGETIIYAPPADGTTASPLVYVYQTTLTF